MQPGGNWKRCAPIPKCFSRASLPPWLPRQLKGTVRALVSYTMNWLFRSEQIRSLTGSTWKSQSCRARVNFWSYRAPIQVALKFRNRTPNWSHRKVEPSFRHPVKSAEVNCTCRRGAVLEIAMISFFTLGMRKCLPKSGMGNGCSLKSRRRDCRGIMGMWRRRWAFAPSYNSEVSSWYKSEGSWVNKRHPRARAVTSNLGNNRLTRLGDR